MPTWSDLLQELKRQLEKGDKGAFDTVRRKYLSQLHQYTGRNTILYATKWVSPTPDIPPEMISITGTDAVEIVSHTGLPEGVAVTPDGRHVYVSYQGYGPIEKPGPVGTYGHDAIGVFDVATNELVVTISSHLIPNVGGPIAISNDGQAWVNGLDACSAPYYDHKGCPTVPGGVINVFSAIKKEHLKTLPIPLDYGTGFISFLRDSTFALIGGSNLKMVDTKTFVLSKVVPIPVSGSIAFTQDSRYAYAPVPGQNQVVLLEISVSR